MQSSANIIAWISLFLTALAQLILAPIIKSKTGAVGLGVWNLILQLFFFMQLIDFGWSNGIVREFAIQINAEKNGLPSYKIKFAQCLLTVTGVIFSISGLCSAFLLPRFIDIPPAYQTDFYVGVVLFSIWGFARFHYNLPLLSLRGRNHLVAYNVLEMIQSAGRPIMAVGMLLANLGLIGVVSGYILAEALSRLLSKRVFPFLVSGRYFDKSILFRTMKFGAATGIIGLSTMIIFYSSSFIIGWKMGLKEIAVYQSSIALPLMAMRVAIIPFTNRLPFLINAMQSADQNLFLARSLDTNIIVVGITFVFLIIVCLINEQFVSWWVGSELYAGNLFTWVFCLFMFLSVVRHNGYMVWQARGTLTVITIAFLAGVPINVVLSLYLIESIGLPGIALAFVIPAIPIALISQASFFLKNSPSSRQNRA